jgi:hypothetical protein
MGTILPFKAEGGHSKLAAEERSLSDCEIVIFPGVRIERQDDPRHQPSGRGKLDGTNARRRPRKTS